MNDVKRPYDAANRRDKARQRRRSVVEAAHELFTTDGFRRTTIAAVAQRAGVSPESIYKGFGAKADLAKAVFDFVLAGDDEPIPIAQRPEADSIRAEPDVRRKIAMYVHSVVRRAEGSAKVQILIRDGRHVDDALNAVWLQIQHEGLAGMTLFGRHLLGTGQLRPGIEIDEVRDILWNYLAVDHYERLVLDRGWPLERFEAWLAKAMISAVCD